MDIANLRAFGSVSIFETVTESEMVMEDRDMREFGWAVEVECRRGLRRHVELGWGRLFVCIFIST